jgi:hypothetical protein
MTDRERLAETHLALDGAVDQLAAAHRLSVGGEQDQRSPWTDRIEKLLGEAVALRNELRDHLLNRLGRPV